MRILFILIMSLPTLVSAQIKIDDVGDGWKVKVDSAITLIKKVSPDAWLLLDSTTSNVEFWLGDRSSTRPDPNFKKGTILLAVDEIELGVVNIAAVLVHESLHLSFHQRKFALEPKQEELTAYLWELLFLVQVPNCPLWLIQNAEAQIKTIYSEK
jgi:hypothetical protein